MAVRGQAYPHLMRGEPPHAEHAKDVHSPPMTALKAEEGFLRPRLGYCQCRRIDGSREGSAWNQNRDSHP